MGRFFFRQGRSYIAGFDRPMVVSLSALADAVADEGFSVLDVWPCENRPPMPFRTPGSCGDQWDYIAIVRRTGPSRVLDVPDRVVWIVDSTPIEASRPEPAPGPAPAEEPAHVSVGTATENPSSRGRWFGRVAMVAVAVGGVALGWALVG